MKTIALVDGFDDGHHLTHLRNYAGALLGMGHRVLELMPDPAHVENWLRRTQPEALDRIRFAAYRHPRVTSPSWRLRRWWVPWMTWREAGRAVEAAAQATGFEPDLVFFCWLDDYIVGAPRLVRAGLRGIFPRRWSGVFFHPWHLRIPDGPTRGESVAAERFLRAAGCPAVAVLDHGIVDRLQVNIGRPVIPFPDETEEQVSARPFPPAAEIRARAAGRKVVGLVGHLSRRKGVHTLLDAAERARDKPWFFVLAGALDAAQRRTFSEDERKRLERAEAGELPNVWIYPHRIEDETEFNTLVDACDVLYAAYELFAHSSGIVTKAAVFRKPVLVSRGFYMEETVRRYRIGLAVDPHDTDEVVGALACLLDEAAFRNRVGEPGFAECHADHAVGALVPAFEKLLATCAS